MSWTDAERAQLRTELLLRYIVLQIGGRSGALLRPRHEAPLLLVARTELWPGDGLADTDRLWQYSRRRLLAGTIERHRRVAVVPLFETGVPQLEALLAVCGLPDAYQPTDDHRQLFARLLHDATATLPRQEPDEHLAAEVQVSGVATAGGRNALEQAQRERIEDALVTKGGNVAAAARLLRVPLRTLWNRMRSLEIDPTKFRVREI